LATIARRSRPAARAGGIVSLGRGVAIDSPDLEAVRADLADAFGGVLTPQDAAGWRPHVTIQNKVSPHEARALQAMLTRDFRSRPVGIVGLAAWWYRGGPWEVIATYPFLGRIDI
jgi:2'-5' RNA ligase